jgi:hypothetical protein
VARANELLREEIAASSGKPDRPAVIAKRPAVLAEA